MQSSTKPDLKPIITVQVLAAQNLTKQELAVLALLCQGLTRKEIARRRHRSVGGVSHHIENIALKLEAHSQAEIVAKAVARGIVSLSLQVVVLLLVSFLAYSLATRSPPASIDAVLNVLGSTF